ncbi:hypothetical protein NKR23_g8385 [Pleurostoma richardsiae]|uniref:Kinetochore protein fta7 n=1 Tax=Pleurostoma richardsiae TaxID=41990 RepID=A0AA38VPL6_9PEZI|nr:hypothetical protein NKR23_g8385 [Pleurostoma richardsiae]
MPPGTPNQKRKRGRPPGASKREEDASQPQPKRRPRVEEVAELPANGTDQEIEHERPRKRRRRSPTPDIAAEPEEADGAAPQRRKGRPRRADQAESSQVEAKGAEQEQPKRRGRGRPSLSEAKEPTAAREDGVEDTEGHASRPGRPSRQAILDANSTRRKAGRPRKTITSQSPNEPDAGETELRRSHRERRSWNPEEIFSVKTATPPAVSRDTTTARRKNGGAFKVPGQDEEETPDSGPRRSHRERRSWNPEEIFSVKMSTPQAATSLEKTRRGRSSLGKGATEGPAQAKKRGRPSKSNDPQPATTDEAAEPRHRGRPRVSDITAPIEDQHPEPQGNRRRGRRSSAGDNAVQVAEGTKTRKRRQSQPESDEEDVEESLAHTVLPGRLIGTTHRISLSTVTSKWNPLDGPSIDVIVDILADAQRTVLLQFRDSEPRREQAANALGAVARRLRAKLSKGQPFPPPTSVVSARRSAAASHENDFHFERTVDASQALENALDPLLHSIALLEREKAKEEAALEQDYAALRTLDTNARAEARSWREQSRKSHVLAPEMKAKDEPGSSDHGRLELVKSNHDGISNAFKDLEDEELVSLSRQIHSHMESMKSNLQQIDGVVPAIVKSKAALQGVLFQHLDAQQYAGILLG